MRITGLEPARLLTIEPKSIASANSATSAQHSNYTKNFLLCQGKMRKQMQILFFYDMIKTIKAMEET